MFRHHRTPSNFKSGFPEPQFADGVRRLEPVTLTQPQIDRAVENAITVPEIVLVTPEVSNAEPEMNAEPERNHSPDAPKPTEPEPSSDLEGLAWDYANGLAGRFWEGLQNYKLPAGASELRALRTELFSELRTLIGRAGEFFAACRQLKMAALSEEHETVRIQCRAAVERREALQKEIGPLDGIVRRRENEVSKAQVLLAAEEESRPKPLSYPSRTEIRAWESRVAKLRAALDAATEATRQAADVRNQIVREIAKQDELLDGRGDQPGLRQKFVVLDAQLKGKSIHDPNTGLVITPEF
ncbi:MAG: hypothetical protein WB566_07460 [Terriglobales bacterium]